MVTNFPNDEELNALAEAAPSVLFIALWRSTGNLELAGWTGAVLALCVLVAQRRLSVKPHPILLGINTHLIFITPLTVGLYRIGLYGVASVIEHNSYWGVLITIFVVGLAMTLFSARGFLGGDGLPTRAVRRGSLILLGGNAAAIAWAATRGSRGFVAVALPIIALILLRRVLLRSSPGAAESG